MARTTRITHQTPTAHVVEFKGRPLPIILEIEGDRLTFRSYGHRKRFSLPIATVFKNAIVATPTA